MVLEQLSKVDIYIGLMLNGLFTGLGAAIGTYLANHHIIDKSKSMLNRIRRKNEKT